MGCKSENCLRIKTIQKKKGKNEIKIKQNK